MKVTLAPELQPFYQHLTHHAVWDKIGKSITTHADIVKAMTTAGLGAVAFPEMVDYVKQQKGID